MNTHTILYLTPAEAAVYSALPEALREGWTVEPEMGTAYEDADVLKVRAGMARFDKCPDLADFVQKALKGETVDPRTIAAVPEHALPELFFTIGAAGVSFLLRSLLSHCATDKDVEGIVGLSHIRRDILQTNASVSFT